jgi:hypothetical protein
MAGNMFLAVEWSNADLSAWPKFSAPKGWAWAHNISQLVLI